MYILYIFCAVFLLKERFKIANAVFIDLQMIFVVLEAFMPIPFN